MKLTAQQISFLDKVVKGEWTLNSQGLVDVNGHVDCGGRGRLKKLPVKFGIVSRAFECRNCSSLESLEGSPTKVGGYFDCSGCKSLETLKGAPQEVSNFICWNCTSLKTLEGAPEKVDWRFTWGNCKSLPPEQLNLLKDYGNQEITWKEVHRLIHSPNLLRGRELGLF